MIFSLTLSLLVYYRNSEFRWALLSYVLCIESSCMNFMSLVPFKKPIKKCFSRWAGVDNEFGLKYTMRHRSVHDCWRRWGWRERTDSLLYTFFILINSKKRFDKKNKKNGAIFLIQGKQPYYNVYSRQFIACHCDTIIFFTLRLLLPILFHLFARLFHFLFFSLPTLCYSSMREHSTFLIVFQMWFFFLSSL